MVSEKSFHFERFDYDWQEILERKNKIVAGQRKGLRFLMKKNKIECGEKKKTEPKGGEKERL